MAIDVTFYTVSKKKNSTAVPGSSASSTTHKCNLRQPCSVENPVIILRNGGGVPSWNYCRILAFGGRYYFVNDWVYQDNCWYGYLNVDVLGSYRSNIANQNFYILRSSTSFDGDVVDYLYPVKATPSRQFVSVADGEFQTAKENGLVGGHFVCGIVGPEGLTNFYAFNYGWFQQFCNQLFANIDWAQNDAQQIGNSVLKCLFNPFQYITSCIWIPGNVAVDAKEVTEIKFGFWSVNVHCNKLANIPIITKSYKMPVKQHPQVSRGTFLNSEPFRKITVSIFPWGRFNLDASAIGSASEISVSYRIDCMTGIARLGISANGVNIHTSDAMLGVPIQISDMQTNIIDSGMSALKSIGDLFSGNFLGAASGIGSAVTNMIPDVQTKGANGTIINAAASPVIICEFRTVSDEDRADNGRPLMKNGTFAGLGAGYYVVENGSFNLQYATENEKESIKSLLESGVYYE